MTRRAADVGAPTATVASPFRHITPGEQIRLEAAARVEDARSSIEALSTAIAAPNMSRNSKLPEPIREVVKAGFEASARKLLQRTDYAVPPRLEALLVLTLDTGMLIQEALDVTFSNIDEHSGRVTLLRDSGNGVRYQLLEEHMELFSRLKTFDARLPVLGLSRVSLERSWPRLCDAADIAGLTLRDLEFESQFQLRMRHLTPRFPRRPVS